MFLMFAMPIAKVIVFLYFEMCHACVKKHYPLVIHLYSHGMSRINDELFTLTL
jgi:hypothetical protein